MGLFHDSTVLRTGLLAGCAPILFHGVFPLIEVLFLAVALSMDAFAVSIGLGSREQRVNLTVLALKAGLWFGIFQGVMPLIGYLGGRGVLSWIENYAPWVAFILLLLVGGKMIYDSFGDDHDDTAETSTGFRVMLLLAIATSIDAVAAGFSLNLLAVDAYLACLIIALTTFLFSWVAVFIGYHSGTWLESRAELFGGTILILIGLKLLLF